MGLRDDSLIMAEAVAVTTDGYIGKALDKGAAGALGAGVFLVVRVAETFDTTEEDGTLQIVLRTSATKSGDDLGGSPVDLLMSKVWAEASLVAGTEVLRVEVPAELLEFFECYADVGAHAFTAGSLDVFVSVGEPEIRP